MHLHELFCLLFAIAPTLAFPNKGNFGWGSLSQLWPQNSNLHDLATNANGSDFLWLPQDEYSGKTFFDGFIFYNESDPTHGTVTYVNQTYAFDNKLAYVDDNGTVIMKGDDTTWLPEGENRSSVRVSSIAQYNTGLFILDVNRAPWGCETNYTGTLVQGSNGTANLNCDGNLPGNAGCGITEWSKASYGPFFDEQGGGVFAMKWDETGIAVYSFYRSAIPNDITINSPDPSNWGVPVAALAPDSCDPLTFFVNHSIIFDITFCGDWAGNSYATSGCPGSCSTVLMDPSNFVVWAVFKALSSSSLPDIQNASWSINSLKVYRKQAIVGTVSPAVALQVPLHWISSLVVLAIYLAWS
ncbi:Glycoside hydrolase family 16 protein [Mycena sanguinolenta]|uniref:Glycoside hydrolase family 16 protein n=1 Tax=Mycena sanguinolenta TaxID=230812 RepID=A0A8H6XEX9_9AGAR|nr:Glycoside hydrolase family 16 protein [Mycena sanguinolenta]